MHLQAAVFQFLLAQSLDGVDGCHPCRKGGEQGDIHERGSCPDLGAVTMGTRAKGRVQDQLDFACTNQVHYVGGTLQALCSPS